MKTVLFFLLILLSSPLLFGLSSDKAITQYIHDVWGKDQGLPQLSVRNLVQTPDGYLWVGTDNGLARFDGFRFTVFGPDNEDAFQSGWISKLCKDRDGGLWIATKGGDLIHYQNGEFKNYATQFNLEDWVQSIAQDQKGTVWIITRTKIGKIENLKFIPFNVTNGINWKNPTPIFFERSGQMWIESYQLTDHGFGRPSGFPATVPVLSSFQDSNGMSWFGTEGEGLIRYHNGKFEVVPEFSAKTIRVITEDHHHNLWVGTANGLFRYHNGKVDSFTTKDGLPDDSVVTILEDSEGNLWVGTQGGGLNRFREGAITPFSKKEGLSTESPFSVFEDRDGTIWIGTSQGLNRYKDGQITVYTMKDGLPSDEVLSLAQDHDGVIWIGSAGGLSKFQNNQFKTYTTKEGLAGNVVFCIFEDHAHVLWIGTIGGISQFQDDKFQTFFSPKKRQFTQAILESREGTVWMNVFGAGLKRFEQGKSTDYYAEEGGLSSNMIVDLHLDPEGTLWIGTYDSGLNRFRNGKFINYTTRNGLHSNSIYRILEDDSGNLWMSSNEGIFSVSKKELNDFADQNLDRIHSVVYGKSEGMRNVECNGAQFPAGWKAQDGKLWFPTAGGIVWIDPNHLPKNGRAPQVHLEDLTVDGKQYVSLKRGLQNLKIPPGKGRLEFGYTAISFSAPEKIRFQYKLEGFNNEWVDASNRRVAYFTNIKPGNYTFRVKAENGDGVWNEAGAAIPFRLEPHFYQTYWFYGLCILSVLYAGWQVHQYRLKRMLELERIRMRIATDLHDDIGAGLTQIAILSEVTQQNPGSNPESLVRISDSARNLIDSMSDIVWAVDPEKDRVVDLVLRMRRFANDMLEGKDIKFKFEVSSLEQQRELDPDVRRHLYLIFKESINNIVRHSGCTEAEISLRQEGNELVLMVKDNGKGIPDSQLSVDDRGGHGLQSMKARAKEMSANLQLISAPDKGTSIILRAPFR